MRRGEEEEQWEGKGVVFCMFLHIIYFITSDFPLQMFRNLPNILNLNLTHCKAITDTVINALFCPVNLPLAPLPPPAKIPLKSLFLKNCARITHAAIVDIAKYGNIQQLELSGCSKLTDEDLMPLAACREMTTLLLESCYKVSFLIALTLLFSSSTLSVPSFKFVLSFFLSLHLPLITEGN